MAILWDHVSGCASSVGIYAVHIFYATFYIYIFYPAGLHCNIIDCIFNIFASSSLSLTLPQTILIAGTRPFRLGSVFSHG